MSYAQKQRSKNERVKEKKSYIHRKWIRLWSEGVPIRDISKTLGFTETKVRQRITMLQKKFGLFPPRPNPKRRSNEDILRKRYSVWMEMWDRGEGVRAISQREGRKHGSVTSTMVKLRKKYGWFPKYHSKPILPKGVAPEIHYAKMIKLWDQGVIVPKIAEELGETVGRIQSVLCYCRDKHGLFPRRATKPLHREPRMPKRHSPKERRGMDRSFRWLTTHFGDQIGDWQKLAVGYIAWADLKNLGNFAYRINAVGGFIEDYVAVHKLFDPCMVLSHPKAPCLPPIAGGRWNLNSKHGVKLQLYALDFLDWILDHDVRFRDFTENGFGERRRFCYNPFERIGTKNLPVLASSVRAPLPYKYIVELREMLTSGGQHFGEWKWAQGTNKTGGTSGSGAWYEVDAATVLLGKGDPDFVWEEREVYLYEVRTSGLGNTYVSKIIQPRKGYFAWSPVAAVALLMKLYLPLRTYQVRVLDGGWTDSERCELIEYEAGPDGSPQFDIKWIRNGAREKLIFGLTENDRGRVGKEQGIFRKTGDSLTASTTTGLFINTNKTADSGKMWAERGYVIHWEHREVLRWLLKLRNWQEKYNPILRPALWTEANAKHFGRERSLTDLGAAPPTCFLFRDAASKLGKVERTLVIPTSRMNGLWWKLLGDYELRLWKDGMRTHAGEKIMLTNGMRVGFKGFQNHFPLHALRVSLLTALAFEGGVSLTVLMKLAGHSRILMAIYYQKLGSVLMGKELEAGFKRASEKGDERVQAFLMQQSMDQILENVIADAGSLKMALSVDPADRSPAGWALVGPGYCLMGGNTVPNIEVNTLGGCFNGGAMINQSPTNPVYASVLPRNCVEGGCRWLVTRPEFIPHLAARLRNLTFHLSEAERRTAVLEQQLKALQKENLHAQQQDKPFLRRPELSRVDSLAEKAFAEKNELLLKISRNSALLLRCVDMLKRESKSTQQQFIAQGTFDDVRIAIQTTSSELLALSGVCLDAEFYTELKSDLRGAEIRRSQIVDRFFFREYGIELLAPLSPEEQLILGNRITRDAVEIIQKISPTLDLDKAMERACGVLEGKLPLSDPAKKAFHEIAMQRVPLRSLLRNSKEMLSLQSAAAAK